MASRQSTVDFLVEQMAQAGPITARKMFGEYAIYCNEKLVALVADDQLYLKPTPAGRAHLGAPTEAPPYPGAKPCFLIPAETWDHAGWLATLIRLTATNLPSPTSKRQPKRPPNRPLPKP